METISGRRLLGKTKATYSMRPQDILSILDSALTTSTTSPKNSGRSILLLRRWD